MKYLRHSFSPITSLIGILCFLPLLIYLYISFSVLAFLICFSSLLAFCFCFLSHVFRNSILSFRYFSFTSFPSFHFLSNFLTSLFLSHSCHQLLFYNISSAFLFTLFTPSSIVLFIFFQLSMDVFYIPFRLSLSRISLYFLHSILPAILFPVFLLLLCILYSSLQHTGIWSDSTLSFTINFLTLSSPSVSTIV